MNKENAPNITLEAFNYLANKAVRQYVNKRYNIYDINQQTTDDLGTLKAVAVLTPKKVTTIYDELSQASGATYEVYLPSDYFHILNCICIYNVQKTYECYDAGYPYKAPAQRLTSDMYSQVLTNYWTQPRYYRPYYYIHEVNGTRTEGNNSVSYETINSLPYDNRTGIISDKSEPDNESYGTDGNGNSIVSAKGPSRTINIRKGSDNKTSEVSYVERGAGIRYGNNREIRCEIRYGSDDTVFKLTKVYIDYIKVPQEIRLTQYQVDRTEDISQVLDYPDYVCQEIINELVNLVMENISDQRLQTHPVVSQSIANPAQQQTEPVAQQQPT